MLTSELVKLLDNEQKLLEYGRSICDSSALEDGDVPSRLTSAARSIGEIAQPLHSVAFRGDSARW